MTRLSWKALVCTVSKRRQKRCAPQQLRHDPRLLCGILASQPFTVTMSGDPSIQKRPMGRVMKPLREMGASIEARTTISAR